MTKVKRRISSGIIIQTFADRSKLFKGAPERSLVRPKIGKSGRDASGRISVRRRGGAHKRKLRLVSTLDEFKNIKAKVIRLEYDPNRSAHIALIQFENGQKRYIVAPGALKSDDIIVYDDKPAIEPGNRSSLENIPIGTQIYDIEQIPGTYKYLARAAGSCATLMALDKEYALLKLPSGELKKIHKNCRASIGQVSNPESSNIKFGKAGRMRNKGIRPSVRGKAMSPRSHPHGGGEGVNPIGLKYPKTPWGKVAIGKRTRGKKNSDKFIVKRAGEK
jgi:large subunit ribosomal protein L2